MSKQERRRVRVAASLGLTVLMSSAILGGVAPLTANAAEAGSEPTTIEVSPMITAPDNPSDALSNLPAGDESAAEVVDEAPVSDEEDEKIEADTPTSTPESNETKSNGSEAKLAEEEQSLQITSKNAEETVVIQPDEENKVDGTWGTVDWYAEDNVLYLSGGVGLDTQQQSPFVEANYVSKVVIKDQIVAPSDISGLFLNFQNVTAYEGLDMLETSSVTKMNQVFLNNVALENLNIESWNVSKVEMMDAMFMNTGIGSLNLWNWTPRANVSMASTFAEMPRLVYLNIVNFRVTNPQRPFGGDNARLQQLEISDQAQFEEVPTPSDMVWVGQWTGHIFENRYLGGYSDTYTLVSTATEGKWGTVDWTLKDGVLTMSGGIGMNVNNLSPWRAIASEVKKVVVTDKIVAPADMSGLFWRFDKVTEFVGLEKIDTSGVVNLWNTFSGTKSLRRIDLTSWDVSKVFDFDNTFFESGVEILNLSTWNPQSVMHMSSTFASMSRLKYLDISGLSSSSSRSLFDENVQKLRTLVLGENIQLMNVPSSSDRNWVGENFGHTFSGNYEGGPADTYHLEAVTASDTWGSVDWRLEENILYLSEGAGTNTDNRSPWAEIASEVETVVLEGDLIAPEDSSSLFADFVHVTEYIGLDRMDISQTRDIGAMFQNNKFVASLDVGDWDTSNVINMSEVFEHCTDLNQLEIQNWKVENVSSLSYFLRGTKLESLDLSGWKISNANLKRTFEGMSELKKLNISNFDTFGDTSEEMMSGLPNLVELTLGDRTFLDSLDLSEGKFWQGDETNHQFTILYGAGYADTYRLVDGVLSTTGIVFLDDRNEKQIGWQVLSGEPGSTISLSTIKIPDGYELQNPDDTIQLSENGVFEDGVINEERTLKRVHKTTTRTIHFRGVPEGYPEKEVQEIKWEWEWLEDSESLKSRLFFFDDLVHSPQSGYEAFAVPEIDGYEADIAVVEAKEFDDELAELPADDEVVVTYTKLDTGDGGDQNPDPNPSQPDPDNGSGSGGSTGSGNSGTGSTGTGSVGGGQLTNLSTGGSTTAGQNQALPQTGSQVASGLTLLGLGLLGLLGFTKRRKRD